jgi:hypothetical protein
MTCILNFLTVITLFISVNINLALSQSNELIGYGGIPREHSIIVMTLENNSHTWKDLDQYYRNTLLVKEQQTDYFKNAKNVAFSILVNVFKIHETAPVEVVEYYVEEQTAMPYTPFSKEYVLCLEKLRETWGSPKVIQYAQKQYQNTELYYEQNSLWRDKWNQEKSRYQPLCDFVTKE